jgi:hypothetical protein
MRARAKVSDAELLAAARRADVRAVNGLPDGGTIAESLPLTAKRVKDRLVDLEADGRVVCHDSVTVGAEGGIVTTVEVPGDGE